MKNFADKRPTVRWFNCLIRTISSTSNIVNMSDPVHLAVQEDDLHPAAVLLAGEQLGTIATLLGVDTEYFRDRFCNICIYKNRKVLQALNLSWQYRHHFQLLPCQFYFLGKGKGCQSCKLWTDPIESFYILFIPVQLVICTDLIHVSPGILLGTVLTIYLYEHSPDATILGWGLKYFTCFGNMLGDCRVLALLTVCTWLLLRMANMMTEDIEITVFSSGNMLQDWAGGRSQPKHLTAVSKVQVSIKMFPIIIFQFSSCMRI